MAFVRNSNRNQSCAHGNPVWGSCCSGLRVNGGWALRTSVSGCAVHWHYTVQLSKKAYTAADGKVAIDFIYLEGASP